MIMNGKKKKEHEKSPGGTGTFFEIIRAFIILHNSYFCQQKNENYKNKKQKIERYLKNIGENDA